MRLFFLLCAIGLVRSQTCKTPPKNCQTYQLYLRGNCIYLCQPGIFVSASHYCPSNNNMTLLTIQTEGENDLAKALLDKAGAPNAFIGFVEQSGKWGWWDGEKSTFNRLDGYSPAPPSAAPAILPSTVIPSERRRNTSVMILIDSSIYSTTSNSIEQLNFYRQLATYIAVRGDAEFAISHFGCNDQLRDEYVAWQDLGGKLDSFESDIINTCIRTQPYDFATAVGDVNFYYYDNSFNIMGRHYDYQAVILLSSITDANVVNAARAFSAQEKTAMITISIGDGAASLAHLAIPSSNYIHISDFSSMTQLVEEVDGMIFGPGSEPKSFVAAPQEMPFPESRASSNPTMCSYLNAADGLWYPESCTKPHNYICMGASDPVTTTLAPVKPSDACYEGFQPISINNDKCYKIGNESKSFADAMSDCQSPPLERLPLLTSIQSINETNQLAALVDSATTGDGMFWIGLRRPNRNSDWTKWEWFNQEMFNYTNWRAGFPRAADGANCVAYVHNDQSWINTDCNKKLKPICAYRYR